MRGRTLRLSMAVLAAALAAAMAIMTAGCGDSTTTTESATPAAGDTIKIGAIVSLTGTYAGLGQPEKNALEMEVGAHQRSRRRQRQVDRSDLSKTTPPTRPRRSPPPAS